MTEQLPTNGVDEQGDREGVALLLAVWDSKGLLDVDSQHKPSRDWQEDARRWAMYVLDIKGWLWKIQNEFALEMDSKKALKKLANVCTIFLQETEEAKNKSSLSDSALQKEQHLQAVAKFRASAAVVMKKLADKYGSEDGE